MGSSVSCQAQCADIGLVRHTRAIPLARIIAPVPTSARTRRGDPSSSNSGRKKDPDKPGSVRLVRSAPRPKPDSGSKAVVEDAAGEEGEEEGAIPEESGDNGSESESESEFEGEGEGEGEREQTRSEREQCFTHPLTRYNVCGATAWTTLARYERLLCEGVRVFELHCYDPVKPNWRVQLHLLHMHASILVSCTPPSILSASSTLIPASLSAAAIGSTASMDAQGVRAPSAGGGTRAPSATGSRAPSASGMQRKSSKELLESEITLQTLLRVTKTTGFITSPYPVILCIRYHGKHEAELSRSLRQELGNILYSPRHDAQRFPSPEDLRNRVVVFYQGSPSGTASSPASPTPTSLPSGYLASVHSVPPLNRHHSLPMRLELGRAGLTKGEAFTMLDISYPLITFQDLLASSKGATGRASARGLRASQAPLPLSSCIVSAVEAQALQETFVPSLLSNVFLVLGNAYGAALRRHIAWQDPYGTMALLSNRIHACLVDWSWMMDDFSRTSVSRLSVRSSYQMMPMALSGETKESDLEVEDIGSMPEPSHSTSPVPGGSNGSAEPSSGIATDDSAKRGNEAPDSSSAVSGGGDTGGEEEDVHAEQTFWWVYRAFFAGNGGAGYVVRPTEVQKSLEGAEAQKEAKAVVSEAEGVLKLSREPSDLDGGGVPPRTLNVRIIELTRTEDLLRSEDGVSIEGRVFLHKDLQRRSSGVSSTWAEISEQDSIDYDFSLEFPLFLPELSVLLLLVRDGGEDRRILAQTALPCSRILQREPCSLVLLTPLGVPMPGCSLSVEVTILERDGSGRSKARDEAGDEIEVIVGRGPRHLRSALLTDEKRSARLTWRKSVSFAELKLGGTSNPPAAAVVEDGGGRMRIPRPVALPSASSPSSALRPSGGAKPIPKPNALPSMK